MKFPIMLISGNKMTKNREFADVLVYVISKFLVILIEKTFVQYVYVVSKLYIYRSHYFDRKNVVEVLTSIRKVLSKLILRQKPNFDTTYTYTIVAHSTHHAVIISETQIPITSDIFTQMWNMK